VKLPLFDKVLLSMDGSIEGLFLLVKGNYSSHAVNREAATGCTIVISEDGVTAGVDVRGCSPGTRATDLLDPVNLVQKVQTILLARGSMFGLDAAAGVMQYLEERKIRFDIRVTRVLIVCGAVLFDLTIGDHRPRPDRKPPPEDPNTR
jgi:L-aminopeptidase/D-esterase-like protein